MGRIFTKAYIILAHKEGIQLRRMIERLSDGGSYFFLHIDKNSDVKGIQQRLNNLPNIEFIENLSVNWGEF